MRQVSVPIVCLISLILVLPLEAALASEPGSGLVYQLVKYEKDFDFKDRLQGGASVTFQYPEFIAGAPDSVLLRLNQFVKWQIPRSTSGMPANDLDHAADRTLRGWMEFASKLEQVAVGTGDMYEVSIRYNAHGLLTLQFHWWSSGGAHPIRKNTFICLDAETGNRLTLEDLLTPCYNSELRAVAERQFRVDQKLAPGAAWSESHFEFDCNQFHLPNNYAVDSAGLLFHYNEYEIAAYVFGEPQIRVNYEAIQDLIPADGKLARVLERAR